MPFLVLSLGFPAQVAASQGFGPGTSVNGLRIEAPPQVLFDSASLLSQESLCAAFDNQRPVIQDAINDAVVQANGELHRQAGSDFTLVRYRTDIAPCRARAYFAGTDTLAIHLDLIGNRFTTNVTAPVISQSMDPRLSVTFDIKVVASLAMPRPGSLCDPQVQGSVLVTNISAPKGQNVTGDIVEFVYPLVDGLLEGKLRNALQSDRGFAAAVPDTVLAPLRAAACNRGFGVIETRYAPGDMFLVLLGTGDKIVDNRCQSGFVWRQIKSDDLVCVTPEERAQVKVDKQLAGERTVPLDKRVVQLSSVCINPSACASAPTMAPQPCLSGFVWREAIAEDFVCVPPARRDKVKADNRAAASRRMDAPGPIVK
ncbi:hypothetical protein [Sphingomicrobium nitratireducens]|uniref:hypothetical protein n=1 Tax=Sphingomicrobium nitratireducens TaxID=2964666 RepID=UPI00223F38AD|nr:hypothetical protein [Sphingomicrobium nitratireducens]